MKSLSVAELAVKLGEAKIHLLRCQPFFAVLLMHMQYSLDPVCETAATDGNRIIISPAFLTRLTPTETEFILLHEIMHVALEHCFRQKWRRNNRFNIACDIVVNDTIKEQTNYFPSNGLIAGEELWTGLPDGRSGSLFSVEEVYDLLPKNIEDDIFDAPSTPSIAGGEHGEICGNAQKDKRGKKGNTGKSRKKPCACNRARHIIDNHEFWGKSGSGGDCEDNSAMISRWRKTVANAALSVAGNGAGNLPLMAKRILEGLRKPCLDWRRMLYNFIRHETHDYSFEQPDRRYAASNCLLPGWNDMRPHIRIWVAIDASGSMSDRQISEVVSEIAAMVRITGSKVSISFFDTEITPPVLYTPKTLAKIEPVGGGGTDFSCIFNMLAKTCPCPDLVVIMTDGYAEIPPQKAARGIPVLWIVNNSDVKIPWGKVARLPSED